MKGCRRVLRGHVHTSACRIFPSRMSGDPEQWMRRGKNHTGLGSYRMSSSNPRVEAGREQVCAMLRCEILGEGSVSNGRAEQEGTRHTVLRSGRGRVRDLKLTWFDLGWMGSCQAGPRRDNLIPKREVAVAISIGSDGCNIG